MKKIVLIPVLLTIIFVGTKVNAQTVYVLQNGARTLFYNTITDATTNLQDGDTLYLPPKPINVNLTLEKRVAVIGAGYHPDTAAVSGITKITGHVYFNKKSKGSSITGVRIEGNVYVKDSAITITRCNLNTLEIQNGTNKISGTYSGDCVIRESITGSNDVVTNTLIERCLIQGNIGPGNKTNNMLIKNCVLTYGGNYFLDSNSNLIIQNSIITGTGGSFSSYATSSITYKNNLFVRGNDFSFPSFVMENNVFSVPVADIFVDAAKGDYHIKPTCTQALTLATDGRQVGIYGTEYPFLVPTYAPRFTAINNAENVVNGKLSVNMTVQARNR